MYLYGFKKNKILIKMNNIDEDLIFIDDTNNDKLISKKEYFSNVFKRLENNIYLNNIPDKNNKSTTDINKKPLEKNNKIEKLLKISNLLLRELLTLDYKQKDNKKLSSDIKKISSDIKKLIKETNNLIKIINIYNKNNLKK